ncbi:ATP-binding protein [Streptomyces carpaticus]|uniref:ATP-binding protein n=1 Tax=Streptomyces carpaticus TaxID=285558 RepID=A0ABV4ZTT0_9ACTN
MPAHSPWWTPGDARGDRVSGARGAAALSPAVEPGPPALPGLGGLPALPSPMGGGPVRGSDGSEPDAAGFATFPLADSPAAPGSARELTRSTLTGWGLARLADDATVIVSELVTNALRYGAPPAGAPASPLPPASADQPFLLSLVHCGGSVLCAVFDPGSAVPVVREPDFFQESGRGLHVLESLAQTWGWTAPNAHGKAVWALLPPLEPDGPAGPAGPGQGASSHGGPAAGREDAEWTPLTRLLLLLELLSGPSWLKALSTRGTEN